MMKEFPGRCHIWELILETASNAGMSSPYARLQMLRVMQIFMKELGATEVNIVSEVFPIMTESFVCGLQMLEKKVGTGNIHDVVKINFLIVNCPKIHPVVFHFLGYTISCRIVACVFSNIF